MKYRITKAEYDALPDALKAHYKQDGDNYQLQVEGYEDPAELRRARDREKENARQARERAETAEAKLAEIDGEKARKAGDIATLEKSWNDKLTAKVGEYEGPTGKLTLLQKSVRESLIEAAVTKLSIALAGEENAGLMELPLQARLDVDFSGEKPVLRVLDAAGKISAKNLDDLEKEFRDNKKYSAIIVASKASGGADGSKDGGSGGGAGTGKKKLSEMGDAERKEWFKRDPVGFRKAVEEQNAARY